MKKIIACLLLVCVYDAFAQDALAPCEKEFMRDYYDGVDKIIDRADIPSPELSLTVIPSFLPEYGVRLAGNKIYYVQLKSSFWAKAKFMEPGWKKRAAKAVKNTETDVAVATINAELAARVKATYQSAIAKANKTEITGLDGVTYRFEVPSVGCGETWSPEPSSANGRLVALFELLMQHSKSVSSSDIQKNEKSIKELLDNINSKRK